MSDVQQCCKEHWDLAKLKIPAPCRLSAQISCSSVSKATKYCW